jgi:hypothetical protein
VRPQVAAVLPFAAASEAHGRMTAGAALGRIVLQGW